MRCRRRHPLVALVSKDLRLQQLAVVVAVICVAALFALALWSRTVREAGDIVSGVVVVRLGLALAIDMYARVHALRPAHRVHVPIGHDYLWIVAVAVVLPIVLAFPTYRYANRSIADVAIRAAIVIGCVVACPAALVRSKRCSSESPPTRDVVSRTYSSPR